MHAASFAIHPVKPIAKLNHINEIPATLELLRPVNMRLQEPKIASVCIFSCPAKLTNVWLHATISQ